MKKLVSAILIMTIFLSGINVALGNDVFDEIVFNISSMPEVDDFVFSTNIEEDEIPNIQKLQCLVEKSYVPQGIQASEGEDNSLSTLSLYTFNADSLTSFNTITGPKFGNGANEPKFSYNNFLEENVSEYSGELTLNFEDLVLDGRNDLDLRIGRTYQTVASNLGEKTLMILPDENGNLHEKLISNNSTYLLDRYNLGVGWGFSFPSVQIATEYIPDEIGNTYQYDEESELYYHSGNGEVYQVEFTVDETDSNLKGYYKKDICFNKNDPEYTNGQVTSEYSMTLSDQTKQYFANDGRLIGIVDRYGNTIKYEHDFYDIVNRVPDGSFRYDDEMWISSQSNGVDDAVTVNDNGKNDTYSMRFRRDNENNDTYIMSQPIQVIPKAQYNFGLSVFSDMADDIKIEIMGYDTAYSLRETTEEYIEDYTANEWYDFTCEYSPRSSVRYVVIKISPNSAEDVYIDNVRLDEPKPLISKITDSIGRIVEFAYSGELGANNLTGKVSLTVKSPDGSNSRILTYDKEASQFTTEYLNHEEQRLYWYMTSSDTEGIDGSSVKYIYEGGTTENTAGNIVYPKLYMRHETKTHSDTDPWFNKPVLSNIIYKDRNKVYEYETVRKHFGDDGYYDTLRVKKTYDMCLKLDENTSKGVYTGEINTVNYSYNGTYNGETFDNETGYPDYTFDEDTTLNEQWTVIKSGKSTNSVTFSNFAVINRTSIADGTEISYNYTNHSTFKNSPVEIKNTITQNGSLRETYKLYSYNSWGGVSSESKEVEKAVKNDNDLLQKYTIYYQYDPLYHFVTQKSYYYDVNKAQAHEKYIYNSLGNLIKTENSVNEIIEYSYENEIYSGLLTKTVQNDPMYFHNLLGGDRIISYTYDEYGLYQTEISESYDDSNSVTKYEYDYITGDLTKETFPDGGYKLYLYYSDGRIKGVQYPCTLNNSAEWVLTVEEHTYQTNAIASQTNGYAYNLDLVTKRYVKLADNTTDYYYKEYNFYDAVGNIKSSHRINLTAENSADDVYMTDMYYHYDEYDRLEKTVDDDSNTVMYTYDGFDRPLTVTDSENNVYRYSYDSVGNISQLVFDGHTESENRYLLTQKYDIYGNVIQNTVYPDNDLNNTLNEYYSYDLINNVVSYTDPNGNETSYFYDAAGRLKRSCLPDGSMTSAMYSSFGEPSSEKIYDSDGKEQYSKITYHNEKGDLNFKFYSYGRSLEQINKYVSDEKGRVVTSDEGGSIKNINYDQLDNPLFVTSSTSQIQHRYNHFGKTASVSSDGSITNVQYVYNVFGNPALKAQSSTYQTGYIYNELDRIVQGNMPSARTENYTYTANGNLSMISTDSTAFTYQYYDNGFVKSVLYPNGVRNQYEYDNLNRITKIIISTSSKDTNLTYTYDANSNVLSETNNGNTTQYSYDSLDRLTGVTYNDNSSVTYEYDGFNNKTKETYSNGDVKEYVYNGKNQLEKVMLNGIVTDTYTYNDAGAILTHNNKTFTYDVWDRLSGYSDGADTYTYKYDANGIRTHKNSKEYITDFNNNVIAEADESGSITDEVVWGNGKPIARKSNGSWYYYVYNAHGDVISMTDSEGNIVNSYAYDPWGNILSQSETVDNPIKYAGEYYDEELDMYYLRARYYDPNIGRFTSLDTLEGSVYEPLDMKRYVYCRNNPVKYVDPSGEDSILVPLGKGWKYRIDAADTNTGTKKHIHIFNGKKSYSQNDDGSPHDKNNNSKGSPPKSVLKKLNEVSGWDYVAKEKDFFSKTEITYLDGGIMLTYANGYKINLKYNPYIMNYEKIKEYYHYIPNDYEITSKVYVVPSIMPISIPSAIPYMVPIY